MAEFTPCADACGAVGTNFRMAVAASDVLADPTCDPIVFDNTHKRFEILAENIEYTDVTVGSRGLTGSLDPINNHLRPGARVVKGTILMEVGPDAIEFWAPKIVGNSTKSVNFWSTNPEFEMLPVDLLMDRESGVYIYRHCAVTRAIFRGQEATERDPDAQIITLSLSFIGLEEHVGAWPVPEPTPVADTIPLWLFGDATLDLDGTQFPFNNFVLTIDNQIMPKMRNFLQVSCLRSYGRTIRLTTELPYTIGSDAAAYAIKFEGPATLQFDGSKNLVGPPALPGETGYTHFHMPNAYQTRKTPTTRGRQELGHQINLQAYRTTSTEPFAIENLVDLT